MTKMIFLKIVLMYFTLYNILVRFLFSFCLDADRENRNLLCCTEQSFISIYYPVKKKSIFDRINVTHLKNYATDRITHI